MIKENEIKEIFDNLLESLSTGKIEKEKKIFLNFLLEIKKELLNKKIELELKGNENSETVMEINEYIKMLTEIEGKYINLFKENIKENWEEITREIIIDKGFIKKIMNIKGNCE